VLALLLVVHDRVSHLPSVHAAAARSRGVALVQLERAVHLDVGHGLVAAVAQHAGSGLEFHLAHVLVTWGAFIVPCFLRPMVFRRRLWSCCRPRTTASMSWVVLL
jgi:hypothetical protein